MSKEFEFFDSRTYRVACGCGHIYITVTLFEGQILRIIAHRKSNFRCDLTFFDAMNRQTSFQTNRELEQTIDDLKGTEHYKEGHFCQNYNIVVKGKKKQGLLAALSCPDAVAVVLEKEIERLSAGENGTQ